MKKIILLLCFMILTSCTTVPKTTPSDELDKTEVQQRATELATTGGFLDYFLDDTSVIRYQQTNEELNIQIGNLTETMNIEFIKNGNVYTYFSSPVTTINFTENNVDKVGFIITHYSFNSEDTKPRIQSIFTTNDHKRITYYSDNNQLMCEKNANSDSWIMPEELMIQVTNIVEQQINEILVVTSELEKMNQLLYLPKEKYMSLEKSARQSIYDSHSYTYQTNQPQKYVADFVASSSIYKVNDNFITESLEEKFQPAAYFFDIKDEGEISAELSYELFFKFQYSDNTYLDEHSIFAYQGMSVPNIFLVLTEEKLNQFRKNYLNSKPITINETKKLSNGIVQSKEEKTIIAEYGMWNNPDTIHGIIIDEISSDSNQIEAYITLYKIYGFKDHLDEVKYYNLTDSNGKPIGHDIIELGEIFEYASSFKDDLITWHIVTELSSDKKYYKLISYDKIEK